MINSWQEDAFDKLDAPDICYFNFASSNKNSFNAAKPIDLPELARFIAGNLPWVSHWALMQLERFGYARLQWENKFVDSSTDFEIMALQIFVTVLAYLLNF